GAPARRFLLPPWPTPPPPGSRPSGASPARAPPPAVPRPVAPADPRPAHPARRSAARGAPRAAPGPNRGPTHCAAATGRRRCPWPLGASRASTGRDTPRARLPDPHTGASDGRDATGRRSPGRLVRIGLLLHRLVGLRAHPDAGMRNRDHEAVAHPQRPRLVGGERL